jgi:hypothetical protein
MNAAVLGRDCRHEEDRLAASDGRPAAVVDLGLAVDAAPAVAPIGRARVVVLPGALLVPAVIGYAFRAPAVVLATSAACAEK